MNTEIVFNNKTSIVLRGCGWSWECHVCYNVTMFSRLKIKGRMFRRGIEAIIWEMIGKIDMECSCNPDNADRCRECKMPHPKLHGMTEHDSEGTYSSSYFCDDECWEKWITNYHIPHYNEESG